MNTIEIYISPKGRKPLVLQRTGPSCWSELTDRQAIALTRLKEKVEHASQTLFVALQLLYGLKKRHQRWLFDPVFIASQVSDPDEQLLFLENGQAILRTLDWIGDLDRDANFPGPFRLYDYHYGTPRVWLKKVRYRRAYHGPEGGLGNCYFDEFIAADKAYQAGNYAMVAAILYRPLDKKTGQRQAFDERIAKDRARLFAQLDEALLQRIVFGFGCTKLNLQRMFGYVFPRKNELAIVDETAPKKPGNWLTVAIGMAKFDVTKIHEIEQTELYLTLMVLNEQIRQDIETEKEIKKLKKQAAS